MDFILSKIINRPKSVAVSADQIVAVNTQPEINSISTISDESPTSGAPNKLGTKKNQNFDVVGDIVGVCESVVDDLINSENVIVADGENHKTDKEYEINLLQKNLNNSKDTIKENQEITSSSDHFNSKVLPDIINVQPNLNINSTAAGGDDSLILLLASNLGGLQIGTPKGKQNLAIPNLTNCDVNSGVSSDDEVFSECQTFTEPITMDSEINQSLHWENVVSSVTSGCMDSLENTLEQIELPEIQNDVADSTIPNTDLVIGDSNDSLINSIVDSNLNTSGNEAMKADTTCQNGQNRSQTSDEEIVAQVESSGLSSSNICDQTSSELHLPDIRIENETESNSLNQTYNPLSDVPSKSESNDLNQTYNPQNVVAINSDSNSLNQIDNQQNEYQINPESNCLNETYNPQIGADIKLSPNTTNEYPMNPEPNCLNETYNPQVAAPIKLSPNTTNEYPINLESNCLNETYNQQVAAPIKLSLNTTNEYPINPESNCLNETYNPQVAAPIKLSLNTTNEYPINPESNCLNESYNQQVAAATKSSPNTTNEYPINPESNCLNETYNQQVATQMKSSPNTTFVAGAVKSDLNPNKLDNTFAMPAAQQPLNATIDRIENFLRDDATSTAKNDLLNGTFDTCNHTTTKTDEEKCCENDLKTTALDRTVSEPMDVDDDDDFEEVKSNKKGISPMKASPKTQDAFFEDFVTRKIDVTFKTPSMLPPSFHNKRRSHERMEEPTDNDFPSNGSPSVVIEEKNCEKNSVILNPSDFDFLLSKGNNNVTVDERNSLLLRFDPLHGHSVPVNQPLQQQPKLDNTFPVNNTTITTSRLVERLSPTFEEDDQRPSNGHLQDQFAFVCHDTSKGSLNSTLPFVGGSDLSSVNSISSLDNSVPVPETTKKEFTSNNFHENQKLLKDRINQNQPDDKKGNVKMSVDVIQDMKIENDVKTIENINSQTDEKQDYKMAELEKKIKNEVLKTEDVEKKLKDGEQREEALLKRITEKDKTISKMSGVLEAYEKAIAELIAEKEQINQNYEKQMTEIKSDRDLNYQHLTSLEVTFSDLHAKYMRSKQITATLKASEEALLQKEKQNSENLRLQEQRYEKMKNHAMQQLEIANNKLESLSKNHSTELTKLKALLKKEEISRLSVNEQLQQKARENEELVKICDELINGQGS